MSLCPRTHNTFRQYNYSYRLTTQEKIDSFDNGEENNFVMIKSGTWSKNVKRPSQHEMKLGLFTGACKISSGSGETRGKKF